MDMSSILSSQSTSTPSQSKASSSGLTALADYDGFLKLFLTQLKYQDPLSPASQEDFMAQTAQFSSLEQLVSLNTKISDLELATRTTAASLIGRKVEGEVTGDDGTQQSVQGLVSQVAYGDTGDLILGLLDGTSLPFTRVTSISQA
jgi:flagellar basal-body rod modification protein FlgD